MNREERVLKYINSSDDFVVNGKRYCENDFYNDVEDLAKENKELKKQVEEKNKPQIFIDTQDIEERYAEGLYQDYLEEENKKYKNQQKEFVEWLENEKDRCLTFYSSTECMYAYDVFKDVLSKYNEIIEK